MSEPQTVHESISTEADGPDNVNERLTTGGEGPEGQPDTAHDILAGSSEPDAAQEPEPAEAPAEPEPEAAPVESVSQPTEGSEQG